MENGIEGIYLMLFSMFVFLGGLYSEGGNILNEKGILIGVVE